jgi:oligopeptide transport system permease protein
MVDAAAPGIALPDAIELESSRTRHRGLWSDAFHRLKKNRFATAAAVLLAGIIVLVLLANYVPAIQHHDPAFQYGTAHDREAPSGQFWFGTDNLGRDTWARVMQGLLVSLQIGLGAVAIQLVIGVIVGGTAALGGRWTDNVMMRLTDLTYAFPDLLAIILLRSVLTDRDWPIIGNDKVLLMIAIALVAWTTIARLIRGQMLSLRERDFVVAAESMGASRWRVVFQHMLPNTLGPVIVATTFAIPLAIFAEAALSFIGFGISPPTASLGQLVAEGNRYVQTTIWMAIFPAAGIAILMLCFTFLGDGLRDALDPRSR